MGVALGYSVATPTLINIVQSCKSEKALGWTPDFLTQDEGAALTKLVDIILPKTDTPSASEVHVHVFIDRFADQVMEKEQQNFLKMSMGRFLGKALKDTGKENAADLSTDDLESVLAKALKVTPEDEVKNLKAINDYNEAIAQGKEARLDDGISRFAFANNIRGMAIWGYKTSEYVGENVLEYLPVPGQYIGCGNVEELTGGKAWSL